MTKKPISVYISGKITGNENYKTDFLEAEKLLNKNGFDFMNPVYLGEALEAVIKSPTHEQYMRTCLEGLLKCDAILMLPNWQYSEGAKVEKLVAESIGLPFIDEKELNH